MCKAVPGWRRRILSGGADPAEGIDDTPPEGFVRLAAARPEDPDDHVHARPAGGVVFALVAMITAGLAVLQTLIPWGPWRVALQASGVLVMFGSLWIWARLNRSLADRPCPCERPVVWIRIVPSIAEPRRLPTQNENFPEPARAHADDSLVEASRVTRS
jgi:hypothetical protein